MTSTRNPEDDLFEEIAAKNGGTLPPEMQSLQSAIAAIRAAGVKVEVEGDAGGVSVTPEGDAEQLLAHVVQSYGQAERRNSPVFDDQDADIIVTRTFFLAGMLWARFPDLMHQLMDRAIHESDTLYAEEGTPLWPLVDEIATVLTFFLRPETERTEEDKNALLDHFSRTLTRYRIEVR